MLSNSVGRQDGIEGFSLLEMMIAVAIVSVLAAVAVPGYFNHMMRSRQTAVVGELMAIKGSQERYFAENGRYAGRMNLLDKYLSGGVTYINGDYKYQIVTATPGTLIDAGTIRADGDPNHDGVFSDAWEVSIHNLDDKPKSPSSNEGFTWSSLAHIF
jgi:prepilin-type N-terminal cleavage/methylation domain-containing protein